MQVNFCIPIFFSMMMDTTVCSNDGVKCLHGGR